MGDLFHSILLTDFSPLQIALAFLVFAWTGFVRSGLGFGGAALGLPLWVLARLGVNWRADPGER